MTKLLALIVCVVALSACATNPVCTDAERESILRENKGLELEKQRLDRYRTGAPIPSERIGLASRQDLLSAYTQSYNEAVDRLQRRADEFNRHCARQ